MSNVPQAPLLKLQEICDCLADLGISISINELKQPTSPQFRSIVECFLSALAGIRRDCLTQPAFHGIHLLTNPELHEESLTELTTLKAALALIRQAHVADASIGDLTAPTAKRVRLILSALINLVRWREDKMEGYSQLTQPYEQLIQQRQTTDDEVARLTTEVEATRPLYEADREEAAALQVAVKHLTDEITEYSKMHTQLERQVRDKKQHIKQLAEHSSQLKQSIAQLTADNATLKQSIVRSPDRLKRTLADLTQQLHTAKTTLDTQQQLRTQRTTTLLSLTRTHEQVKDRTSELAELKAHNERIELLTTQARDYDKENTALEQTILSVDTEETEAQKRLAAWNDKLQQLKRNYERKRMEGRLALEEVEVELRSSEAEVRDERRKREEVEREVERVRVAVQEGRVGHESCVRVMRGKGREMQRAVGVWHEKLLQGMAAVEFPNAPNTPARLSRGQPQQQEQQE